MSYIDPATGQEINRVQIVSRTGNDVSPTQGTNSSSLAGPMVQAVVSDAPNSFLSDVVQPLSMTSEGRLRVSAVSADVDRVWQHTFDNPFTKDNPYV